MSDYPLPFTNCLDAGALGPSSLPLSLQLSLQLSRPLSLQLSLLLSLLSSLPLSLPSPRLCNVSLFSSLVPAVAPAPSCGGIWQSH